MCVRLLCLPRLGKFLLAPPLRSLSTSLGIQNEVPPPEAAGVISDKLLVVDIVVLSAGPDGEEVVQAPWELVAAVRIDGLENTEDNPSIHGQNVKVLGDGAPQNWAANSSESQHHDLDWRSVLSGQAERSRILVVDLVDVLVQKRACVHGAMHPVMPGVLQNEEDGNLVCHLPGAGERNRGLEAEVLAHRVEHPNLGELNGEM